MNRPTLRLACATTLVLAGLLPQAGQAGTFTAIELSGAGHYPSSGVGSVGNEIQISDAIAIGQTASALQNQAIANSGTATDGNGTQGSASYSVSGIAQAGTLHAYATSAASSTAPGGFPHADASTFAWVRFWSTVRLFDPTVTVGAAISATLNLDLDWNSYAAGSAGNANSRAIVSAEVKLDLLDVTASGDTYPSGTGLLNIGGPASGLFTNGDYVGVYGQLQVLTQSSVGGYNTGTVNAQATSDAAHTLHLYISGAPTLTAIGEDGTNYVEAVPEPGSATLLAGGVLALWRRRRG